MKNLLLILLCLVLFGMVSAAQAGIQPKNTTIVAHCGCNDAGDGLEYVYVDVGNGRGHNNHRVQTGEDAEFCRDEVDEPNMSCQRTRDDCVIAGDLLTAKGNQTVLIQCVDTIPYPTLDCGAACVPWTED